MISDIEEHFKKKKVLIYWFKLVMASTINVMSDLGLMPFLPNLQQ